MLDFILANWCSKEYCRVGWETMLLVDMYWYFTVTSQKPVFFMVTAIQYSCIRRLFYKPFYCGRGERAGTWKIKVNSYQTIHHHITEDSIFPIRLSLVEDAYQSVWICFVCSMTGICCISLITGVLSHRKPFSARTYLTVVVVKTEVNCILKLWIIVTSGCLCEININI
jgi:hypothetical protein